jgi:enolase-phosphatase E1
VTSPERPGAILLDIEGTTTPISFVTQVLFPYARTHVRQHLEQHASRPAYAEVITALREEHRLDEQSTDPPPPWNDAAETQLDAVVRYVEWLMDRDRKSTPLKVLQGRIWEEGYRHGEIVGEVFEDVPPALAAWQREHLPVSIFSSGSVLAQQLLFRHSSAGDLTGFISGHFDTTVGPKIAADSYRRIAAAVGKPPESILFISDITRELDAARAAGLQTRLAVRPGNALPPPGHGYREAHSFDDVIQ